MHNQTSKQQQSQNTTKKNHNHSRHIWHFVGMIFLIAGALVASSYMPTASWLYFIPLLLVCPLMMISMMYFMQPDHDHAGNSSCHVHNASDKVSGNEESHH